MNALDDILKEAEKRSVECDPQKLRRALAKPTRPLTLKPRGNTVIAEIKYRSPSSRMLLASESAGKIAAAYEAGGAAALSVLTEGPHFGGSPELIAEAKERCALPVLRKDFLINESHLVESRILGADAVLLIAKILGKNLPKMAAKANSMGLWPLVEVHDEKELELALSSRAKHIGVNNRSLDTLEVDLATTVALSGLVPKDRILVVESGIKGPKDIQYLKKACARKPDAYLIGTTLMKAEDKEKTLRELVNA